MGHSTAANAAGPKTRNSRSITSNRSCDRKRSGDGASIDGRCGRDSLGGQGGSNDGSPSRHWSRNPKIIIEGIATIFIC